MLKTLKNNGFTLIELAMVIMIGGILLGTLSSAILIYLKKRKSIQQNKGWKKLMRPYSFS